MGAQKRASQEPIYPRGEKSLALEQMEEALLVEDQTSQSLCTTDPAPTAYKLGHGEPVPPLLSLEVRHAPATKHKLVSCVCR